MPSWTPSFSLSFSPSGFGETNNMEKSGAYFPSLFSVLNPGRLAHPGRSPPGRKRVNLRSSGNRHWGLCRSHR